MADFADQTVVSCLALRAIKDWIQYQCPFDENPTLIAFRDDYRKDYPSDTIFYDQTLAVAFLLAEEFERDKYPHPEYLQEIIEIIANTHESEYQKKGVLGRLFTKGPTAWDASMRVVGSINDIKKTMDIYSYDYYLRDSLR